MLVAGSCVYSETRRGGSVTCQAPTGCVIRVNIYMIRLSRGGKSPVHSQAPTASCYILALWHPHM